jgi:FkbM family methyltransferase
MWKPSRLYSQNFEDLYLHRIFSSIETGFYVDAGAWHPLKHSVTALFYEHGWRGINIEPVSEIFEVLSQKRPLDINLCLAVVDKIDIKYSPMVVVGDDPRSWGHHRISPKENSSNNSAWDQHEPAKTRNVASSTLYEIIAQYAKSQPINFLKLDVEGFEHKALVGLNLPKLELINRPQVILLEATLPGTRLSAPHRLPCRDYLESNSYKFLFHDGLNDYYCDAMLHSQYMNMMLPPNIFDAPSISASDIFDNIDQIQTFSSETVSLGAQVDALKNQLSTTEKSLENIKNDLESEVVTLKKKNHLLEQELLILKRQEEQSKSNLANLIKHKTGLEKELSESLKKSDRLTWRLHQAQEEIEQYFIANQQAMIDIHKHVQSGQRKDAKLAWLRGQRELLLNLIRAQANLHNRFQTLIGKILFNSKPRHSRF